VEGSEGMSWSWRACRGPAIGSLEEGAGHTGSDLAQGSLDPSLHTQQQVVPEERWQWEPGGSLPAATTQLNTHSQSGQVLQPPRLIHHAHSRAVEGFVLLGQEGKRITLDSVLPSGCNPEVGAPRFCNM
jgi:hypothetical protein